VPGAPWAILRSSPWVSPLLDVSRMDFPVNENPLWNGQRGENYFFFDRGLATVEATRATTTASTRSEGSIGCKMLMTTRSAITAPTIKASALTKRLGESISNTNLEVEANHRRGCHMDSR